MPQLLGDRIDLQRINQSRCGISESFRNEARYRLLLGKSLWPWIHHIYRGWHLRFRFGVVAVRDRINRTMIGIVDRLIPRAGGVCIPCDASSSFNLRPAKSSRRFSSHAIPLGLCAASVRVHTPRAYRSKSGMLRSAWGSRFAVRPALLLLRHERVPL